MYVDYKKLLDKIQQNNFTITQALEEAGCSYTVITSIKNGKCLSKKTVWKLATALGCRVNDLLEVSCITELPLKPVWHEGQETKQEEALWPYATCIIANQLVCTQNIGTLKAMARDKAINIKGDVFVDVVLPGGEKITFAFDKNGQQRRLSKKERSKDAERREPEKMPADSE